MDDDQIRKQTVVCLAQSGSRARYWLEVQCETSDDWTGLILATMDNPDGGPAAGTGMPITFPKWCWRKVTAKELM